jgi:hypothetical protein
MPAGLKGRTERKTIEKARKAKREGKAPTTQAGEYVRLEIDKIRRGEHGARSPEQAIANFPSFFLQISRKTPARTVHMFVEIPPHIAVSDFVRRVKGRSSHRVQMEFPGLRKRYWGRAGLLLHHERQHHGRCHTSISSRARTQRRQPVVIQWNKF